MAVKSNSSLTVHNNSVFKLATSALLPLSNQSVHNPSTFAQVDDVHNLFILCDLYGKK
jgi:hypothetical protein